MKMSVMISKVRKKVRDKTSAYWTDAELLEYLNDAGTNVAWKSKCIQDNGKFEAVEDTAEYEMAGIFPTIIDVTECWFYTEGSTWVKLDYKSRAVLNRENNGWKNVDASIPISYDFDYERDKTLSLFPAPDGANAGEDYVEVYYAKAYTFVTDTNVEPTGIPHALQLAMIEYACAECFSDRAEENKATEYKNRYNSHIKEYLAMRQKEENREDDVIMK